MIKLSLTKYLIIALVLVLVYASFMTSAWRGERDRANRMTDNFVSMRDSTARLIRLTKEEFKKVLDERTDSILHVASIKPKWVREVHNYTNTYYVHDTVYVETEPPVTVNDTVRYPFDKKIDCMSIEGFMTVDTFKVPHLYLTSGTGYENKTTSIVYQRRSKKKILFFNLRIGRKEYELHTTSDCGDTKVEVIKIEKQ